MRRLLPATVGAFLLVWGVSARQASVWSPSTTAPLHRVPIALDFDNDGIPDRLFVDQADVGIALSRSGAAVSRLEHRTFVVGLVAIDVDRDGDTDVLTLTAAGNLWLWRNDGRGRFAAEPVVPAPGLARSMAPSLGRATTGEFMALSDSPGRGWRPLAVKALGAVAPAFRGARARTRPALAVSLDPSVSSDSPRAPPHTFAIV